MQEIQARDTASQTILDIDLPYDLPIELWEKIFWLVYDCKRTDKQIILRSFCNLQCVSKVWLRINQNLVGVLPFSLRKSGQLIPMFCLTIDEADYEDVRICGTEKTLAKKALNFSKLTSITLNKITLENDGFNKIIDSLKFVPQDIQTVVIQDSSLPDLSFLAMLPNLKHLILENISLPQSPNPKNPKILSNPDLSLPHILTLCPKLVSLNVKGDFFSLDGNWNDCFDAHPLEKFEIGDGADDNSEIVVQITDISTWKTLPNLKTFLICNIKPGLYLIDISTLAPKLPSQVQLITSSFYSNLHGI